MRNDKCRCEQTVAERNRAFMLRQRRLARLMAKAHPATVSARVDRNSLIAAGNIVPKA